MAYPIKRTTGVQIASWKRRNPWTSGTDGLFDSEHSVLRLGG